MVRTSTLGWRLQAVMHSPMPMPTTHGPTAPEAMPASPAGTLVMAVVVERGRGAVTSSGVPFHAMPAAHAAPMMTSARVMRRWRAETSPGLQVTVVVACLR